MITGVIILMQDSAMIHHYMYTFLMSQGNTRMRITKWDNLMTTVNWLTIIGAILSTIVQEPLDTKSYRVCYRYMCKANGHQGYRDSKKIHL